MTSQERADMRHDAALLEEKLYKLRVMLDANSAAGAWEFATEVREVADRIASVAAHAVERDARGVAA